jgi:PHD/YefM family antitoxin component YafN of YafNO toxin-antitoxin module
MVDFITKEVALGRLTDLIQEISKDGSPCYITDGGVTKAVILDVDRYHAMMDAIEELGTSQDRNADMALIERLITTESRKRKKSIRFFGVKSKQID